MKSFLFCFIITTQLINLINTFSNKNHEEQNSKSIPCIKQLCDHYFRSEHAMRGSLLIMNLTPNPSTFQSKIIESVNEDRNHEFSVAIKDSRKENGGDPVHVRDKAQNYFMFIVSSEDVNSTVRQWRSLPTWNPMAQVMGLFTEVFDQITLDKQVRNVFSELMRYDMLNVNLMYNKMGTNVVEVVTWFPYEGTNCANNIIDVHVIDNCEYESNAADLSDVNVTYSRKKKQTKIPSSLHGCVLKISSGVWEPYTYYDFDSKHFTKGIEVLLLQTISEVLQLSTVYNFLNESRENRLSTKLTQGYVDLIDGTSDVMIGGMDEDSNTRKLLSSSIPYYQDDQTWCVAKAKPDVLWRNIFNLFTTLVWILLILVVYLMALTLYFFIKLDRKSENFVWMLLASLSVTMGLATNYEPKNTNSRLIFFIFLFYGLLFSTAFHSFLVGVLTNPRQKHQVENLEQAVTSKLQFYGGAVALEHFDGKDEVTTAAENSFHLCLNIDECYANLKYDDFLAVATSREHAVNNLVLPKTEVFCFSKVNNIYSFSVAMMTKRYFHLLPAMNSIIRRVLEFGLIEKWAKDNSESTLKLVKNLDNGSEHEHLVVLTVGHIAGALIIMFAGYAIALCAFICEMIVAKRVSKSKYKFFWTFLDKLFDTRQYF